MRIMKDHNRPDFSVGEHLLDESRLEEMRVALQAAEAGSKSRAGAGSPAQADLIAFDLEMPTWDGFAPLSRPRR